MLPALPAGAVLAQSTDGMALKLGTIGVDAPIIPTGVNQRTGQMAVPNNVREVAWYSNVVVCAVPIADRDLEWVG